MVSGDLKRLRRRIATTPRITEVNIGKIADEEKATAAAQRYSRALRQTRELYEKAIQEKQFTIGEVVTDGKRQGRIVKITDGGRSVHVKLLTRTRVYSPLLLQKV